MAEKLPPLQEDDPRLFRMGDAYAFATYPVCGVVFTDKGAVAIDGPMAPATALQWRAFIENRVPVKFHILCEHHEDHCACCSVLGADTLISSEITAAELARCASGSLRGAGMARRPRAPSLRSRSAGGLARRRSADAACARGTRSRPAHVA